MAANGVRAGEGAHQPGLWRASVAAGGDGRRLGEPRKGDTVSEGGDDLARTVGLVAALADRGEVEQKTGTNVRPAGRTGGGVTRPAGSGGE